VVKVVKVVLKVRRVVGGGLVLLLLPPPIRGVRGCEVVGVVWVVVMVGLVPSRGVRGSEVVVAAHRYRLSAATRP